MNPNGSKPAERFEVSGGNRQGFPATENLLTIQEVAELLKVPVSWVYEHCRQRAANQIPNFRLGKYLRFRKSDVLAWLEAQRRGARPNA